MGGWINEKQQLTDRLAARDIKDAGVWLQFDAGKSPVVQARSGLSLVSIANAADNLEKEISTPFGWKFDEVRTNQQNVWNDLFDRVQITTNNRLEKVRFIQICTGRCVAVIYGVM